MKKRSKTLLVAALTLVSFFLLIVVIGWLLAWQTLEPFGDVPPIAQTNAILTDAQYGEVIEAHRRPYVYQLSSPENSVMIFGFSHTNDPQDSQFDLLSRVWSEFDPTVVLLEGRLGFLPPLVADPVRQFSESGYVYRRARQDGINSYTWEQSIEAEVAAALEQYPAEQVALFVILRPYFSNLRYGKPEQPEQFVEQFRANRVKWNGLEGTFANTEELDRVWQRDFAGYPDWRDTSDQYGLPGYLQEIARVTGQVRDKYLASLIVHFAKQGERVLATMGLSHAVKIEPALALALEIDSEVVE